MADSSQGLRTPLFSELGFLYEKPDDPIPSIGYLYEYHKWRRENPEIPDPIEVPLVVGSLDDVEDESMEMIKEVCAWIIRNRTCAYYCLLLYNSDPPSDPPPPYCADSPPDYTP